MPVQFGFSEDHNRVKNAVDKANELFLNDEFYNRIKQKR